MSYCGQERCNFFKLMSIALPDGYILDTVGLLSGSENDAKITKKIIESLSRLEKDDNVVFDHGFRDVFPDLRLLV